MKTTVSTYDFRDAFRQAGRDNFSYEALNLLFDYFEELEADMGSEMELDVVAICCSYSEDTVENIAGNCDIDLTDIDTDDMDDEEIEAAKLELVMAYLNDHTSVVGETSSGIVYADF